SQQEVFEGLGAKSRQPCVHARRVRVHQLAVFACRGLAHEHSDGAKAVSSHPAVLRQGGRTEELGELSSGRPPQQIHLEEAVLSMDKAQSARSVQSIRGADGGNSERIAVDKDGSTEAWHRARSVKLRQARPELQTSPDRRGDYQRSTDGGQREQCSAELLPKKISALRRRRCGTCGRFVAHRNTFRVLPNAAAKNTRARQFTETRSGSQQ